MTPPFGILNRQEHQEAFVFLCGLRVFAVQELHIAMICRRFYTIKQIVLPLGRRFPKEYNMELLLTIHSAVRWAIVVIAVIAIIFALGLGLNSTLKGMDRGLASGFSGLMDLQVLIGLIYFVWNGIAVTGFPTYRILHMIIMILAAVVGHLPSRFKSLPDKPRFQYSLFAVIGSLALVLVGISVLH
jgi:hypothetical protein